MSAVRDNRMSPMTETGNKDGPLRAVYAFSGDPITLGHVDIVRRAARTYDELVVAIGENPEKSSAYLFSRAKRLELARQALEHLPNVTCVAFDGLLAEYAYRNGFDVIVRGVRNNSDLEGELELFAIIKSLHPSIDVVFLPAQPELAHISSRVTKAIVSEGGDVSAYCPLHVKEALERRILDKFFVGIAGGIAAGKSRLAEDLVAALSAHVPATHINLDSVGHYVLGTTEKDICQRTRRRIAETFGAAVQRADGSIDRQKLGRIVFDDPRRLAQLDEIMRSPMLARLYEQTRRIARGVIILEGAILVEAGWTQLVNNRVILVDAPEDVRIRRLVETRGMDRDEAATKVARQPTAAERRTRMQTFIEAARWGQLWEVDTGDGDADAQVLAREIVALREAALDGHQAD